MIIVPHDFDVTTVIGQINESRDNRFAVIGCQLFNLDSYYGVDGRQAHIGTIWDADDCYNPCDAALLNEVVHEEASHVVSYRFDTREASELWFIKAISNRLQELG
ncbi:MAG: hypothetical protein RR740_00650 [Pseudomonas sp.]